GMPSGCSLFGGRKPAMHAVNDRAIVDQIRAQLAEAPELKGAQVNVQSANGIVELTGTVESLAQKSRAGLIAASAAEVAQVHNDVLVSNSPAR
ncbi:MAG: BON domain-containing protein, partial [Limisphaerales bacterium]